MRTSFASEHQPWDTCSLTGLACEVPVCEGEGSVYEMAAIVAWIKEHHASPMTGNPLQVSDLFRLHFERDPKKQLICPITKQPLTEKAVTIRSVGRVYSADAIENIIGAGRSEALDPVDGVTSFTRADLLSLVKRAPAKLVRTAPEKAEPKEKPATNDKPVTATGLSAMSTSMPVTAKSNAKESIDRDLVESVANEGNVRAMVILQTAIGDLTIELFCSDCPWACLRFTRLVKLGFFEEGCEAKITPMMVQMPMGNGEEEAKERHPHLRHDRPGTVSFTRDRLIIGRTALQQLDQMACLFGQVVGGVELLNQDIDTLAIKGALLADDPFEKALRSKPEIKEQEKRRREAIDPTLIHKRAKQQENTTLTIGRYIKK